MPSPWERLLRSMPRTRLADVTDGARIKVVGQLRFTSTRRQASLSGRRVGAYHVLIVARFDGDTPTGPHERVLIDERHCGDFLLDDAGALALVRGAGTTLQLDIDLSHSPWFDSAHPDVTKLLQSRGVRVDELPRGARIHGYEGVLVDGETVVVCGRGQYEADPTAPSILDYRAEAGTRYVIAATTGAREPTLVSDERELIAAGRIA